MSSEKRKAQLQEIKEKLKNSDLSLLEVANFGNMVMAVYANSPPQTPEEVTKEEHFLAREISDNVNNKFIGFIDRWNRGEIKPNEKELRFLKKFNSLIDQILAHNKQQTEALKHLKHLSEDDRQKLIEATKKDQENWKKYQPILNDLVEKEERESEEEENSIDSATEEQISQPTNTKSSNTSSPNSDNKNKDTPWHIIIPVGIAVIGLVGLAGFLIWRKKNSDKELPAKK